MTQKSWLSPGEPFACNKDSYFGMKATREAFEMAEKEPKNVEEFKPIEGACTFYARQDDLGFYVAMWKKWAEPYDMVCDVITTIIGKRLIIWHRSNMNKFPIIWIDFKTYKVEDQSHFVYVVVWKPKEMD